VDVWKVVKWVLIVLALWWAWNWISNNFASSSDTGSSEVYPAPYAGPLQYAYPIRGWSPSWYGGARYRGPRRPRPGSGAWVGGKR